MSIEFKDRLIKLFSEYDGFDFVIHKHLSERAGLHYDLRFVDLHNNKELQSFALPKDFMDMDRVPIYKSKMTHLTKDWLDRDAKNIEVLDKGKVDYKIYKPSRYFELYFHGNILKGIYKIWKLDNTKRDDVWLLYS